MNAQQLPVILKAHRRLVMICMLVGLVLGLIGALIRSPVYEATAQVLTTVRSPESVDDTSIQPQLSPDYLATQVDIVKSERVAARAAERLKIAQDPQSLATFRSSGVGGDPNIFFARQLTGGLQVVPSAASRVISIKYTAADPQSAATVANAFAAAYQDASLDMQVAPARQSGEWYARNMESVRARLEEAQRKLTARQQQLGITATLDQADAEEARLAGLSQALAAAQAGQAAASSRTGGGSMPDAMLNPVVQGLDADVKRLEAQRSELATRAGPNSLDMRELSNQIASLRRERDAQASAVARSASAAAGQAAQNVRDLERQVAAQKSLVIKSRAARGEAAALQQDVDGLRKSYNTLVDYQSRAALVGSGEQTNVSILSPASPPQKPAGVPRFAIVLAGIFFGFLIGTVLAIVREFADQRIRSAEDAEIWLGIPNLGAVHALAAPAPRLLAMPRRLLPPPSQD